MSSFSIQIHPAFQGDTISILFNMQNNCILIDTGTKRSYLKGSLKEQFKKIQNVDLLILTHTDEDHIGGILKYYEDNDRKTKLFKNVWFNTEHLISRNLKLETKDECQIHVTDCDNLNMSLKQGLTLEKCLLSDDLLPYQLITSGKTHEMFSAEIQVLSPEIDDLIEFHKKWEVEKEYHLEVAYKTDYNLTIPELLNNNYTENGTLANKSSIAFIFNYKNKKILLMGDAFPSVIETNIRKLGYNESNKLKLEVVKVSHHGSKNGMSSSLLNIIDCDKFVISTNGSNGLPSKECLARIVAHKDEKIFLYFNYENENTKSIFFNFEYEDYNFEVVYLNDNNNYTIEIGE
jgi:beta-lactamase superfamily II metal-dependent hydrolase